MKPIDCPFCGPRELREFVFHKTVATTGSRDEFQRIYLRVADPQSSVEHWQHVAGCRAWLRVHRNPTSGEVLAIDMLAGDKA